MNYPETTEVVEIGANIYNSELAEDNKYQNVSIESGNFSITTNGNYWITGLISVKPNTQYRVSLQAVGAFYIDEETPITTTRIYSQNSFTTPINANYVCLCYSKEKTPFNSDIMLCEGNTLLDYQPYTERKVNINYPLASVSDTIRDRYYVKDSKKYHEQVVKEIVFDGSENWVLMNNDKPYFSLTVTDIKLNTYSGLMGALCNRFIECTPNELWKAIKSEGFVIESERCEIRVRKSDITTVENWKTWLKSNNTKVMYELATPITTEIETEDWYSFDGQTNITTTNTVKPTLDLDIPTALVINSGKEM